MRRVSPTLAVLFVAGLVYCLPELQPLLIYDRAAILGGEYWRLLTGHWVHFSGRHLGIDLAVLGLAGLIIERHATAQSLLHRNPLGPEENDEAKGWRWLLGISPVLIGVGMLVAEPGMHFYGGLSGVATAAVVYLALKGVRDRSSWRWICCGTLVVVFGKVILECVTGRALFAGSGSDPFVPVPLSHILGACSAILMWTFARRGPLVGADVRRR